MNCMRCGKETEDKAVFCPECLEDMAKYPVKPGTTVHIPIRQNEEIKKAVKKKPELTPEEQLREAQKIISILFYTAVSLLVALILTGALLFHALFQSKELPTPAEPSISYHQTITPSVEG